MRESKLFYSILFCILLITFLIRTFNTDAFIDHEHREVIISDNDAGYHLRRIVDFATGASDHIQFPDIRSYYPEGYVCHWSPGFDFLLGTLGKIFYFFKPDVYSLKIFICMLIPILAVFTIFAYYFLSVRLLPPAAALISAFLFAFLPFHITITYFALVDHHVVEFLFLVLMYLGVFRAGDDRGVWMTSLVIVSGFWIVPGFVLDYMIFTGTSLIIVVSGRIWQHHEEFVRRLPKIHIISAALLILTLFFSYYGAMLAVKFESLSLFHGIIVLIGAVVMTIFSRVCEEKNVAVSLLKRLGIAIFAITLIVIVVPGFLSTFSQGLDFAKGNRYISISKEVTPIRWETFTAGYLDVLWPLEIAGICIAGFRAYRRKDPFWGLFSIPPFAYGILCLAEMKFFRYFCVFSIIAAVAVLYEAVIFAWRFGRMKPVIVSVLILMFIWGFQGYDRVFRMNKDVKSDPAYEVCSFIGRNYKRTENAQTVFSHWDIGHKIIYYTDFYNVDNPFLIRRFESRTRDAASLYFSTDEKDASAILHKYKSGLLILRTPAILIRNLVPLMEKYFRQIDIRDDVMTTDLAMTLFARLHYFDGNAILSSDRLRIIRPAITSLRLVFESAVSEKSYGMILPQYKVYESVPGASIVGAYSHETEPILRVELKTNIGRQFVYEAAAEKTPEGRFIFRVPYAAPGENLGVTALSPYRLLIGEKTYPISVNAEDVLAGKTIEIIP